MSVIIIILEERTKTIFVMKIYLKLHYGYDVSDNLFQTYSATVIRVIYKNIMHVFFFFLNKVGALRKIMIIQVTNVNFKILTELLLLYEIAVNYIILFITTPIHSDLVLFVRIM